MKLMSPRLLQCLKFLWSIPLWIFALTACSSVNTGTSRSAQLIIENTAISPNGEVIAFQYLDKQHGHRGIGLFEWKTGKVVPIPRPSGKNHMGAPSFSTDGQRLLAMVADSSSGELVSIDLRSLERMTLAPARRNWSMAVAQPGTDNVLLVMGGHGTLYHLILVDTKTGKETVVLKKGDGFAVGIFTPSFIGPDEIVFEAIGPRDPALKQGVSELSPHIAANIPYRLKFGERPEFILSKEWANKEMPRHPGFSSLSASDDGSVFAFIAPSRIEPLDAQKFINFEIFVVKAGTLRQVTNVRSHLAYAKVSRDGDTVVFGANADRAALRGGASHDLYVLDLRTGSLTSTSLPKRLQDHPDFRLP